MLGSEGGLWEHVERLPRRWEASQIAAAYRAACRILRQVGLPLFAYETWCWRDPQGVWWALPDDTVGGLIPGADELCGAWLLPRRGRSPEAGAYPPEFIADFGGPSGPLEWAFWVVDAVQDLRSFEASRRVAMRELAKLRRLPEWEALEAAAVESGDPVLESALLQARRLLDTGGAAAVCPAFIQGFELGQGFGEYTVLDSVSATEARRVQLTGKPELRGEMLRAIETEEVEAPLKPYVLADKLIAETTPGQRTPRGARLAELGLAADRNTVGAMISKIARARKPPQS